HYFHGNLILALWLVWLGGGFPGGLAGGGLLGKLGAVAGEMQKSALRLSDFVAIAGGPLPFRDLREGERKKGKGGPPKKPRRKQPMRTDPPTSPLATLRS